MPQSDDHSPHLGLPYLLPAQAQKHVTHNEALRLLDLLVQLAVSRRDLASPPSAPAEGERHIVGTAAASNWAGQEGRIAVHEQGSWSFITPQPGWRVQVLTEGTELVHDGAVWVEGPGRLGVNATPDSVNRLAVAAEAALFTHAGSDHRLKINKADTGDTASMLFQSGWTGYAEIGLAGNDDLTFKVFDGAGWYEALTVDAAAHALRSEGALLYHQGNILGAVTQAGGQATGAVFERGSSANGHWLRLADGTQICSHRMSASSSAATLWTYPQGFVAPPVISGVAEAMVLSALCLDAAPQDDKASFSLRDATNTRRGDMVHLQAVGRWF